MGRTGRAWKGQLNFRRRGVILDWIKTARGDGAMRKNLFGIRDLLKNRGTRPKLIAFTFDDGPSFYTGALLDGLRTRGAAATFFMTGRNGDGGTCGIQNGHEALLARMWEEGHQLANHTYRHAALEELPEERISAEVTAVERLIFQAAGGSYSCFVRTPSGVTNETILRRVNAPLILWSVDALDWKYRDADAVYSRLLAQAENGSIVLLHDLYETSVDGALRAVDTLKKRGYEFVTVAELLRRTGLLPVNGAVYSKAGDRLSKGPYPKPGLSALKDRDGGPVSILCSAPEGLAVYYTTDGSFPRLCSRRYTGPVPVEPGTVLTAAGIDEWGTRTPPAVFRAGPSSP